MKAQHYKIERLDGGFVVKPKQWDGNTAQWYFDALEDAKDWRDYQERSIPVCMHGRNLNRSCADCITADLIAAPHVGDRGL